MRNFAHKNRKNMSELEPMMADLALILICAGVMTLIFKRLKQPLVLGYIVAGFLASPNMPYMPSVTDLDNVHLWSDIGVVFLLFALGLEFSFKKIMKMGSAHQYDGCRSFHGLCFWLEPDGLHLPWRHVGHVQYDYHFQGFR